MKALVPRGHVLWICWRRQVRDRRQQRGRSADGMLCLKLFARCRHLLSESSQRERKPCALASFALGLRCSSQPRRWNVSPLLRTKRSPECSRVFNRHCDPLFCHTIRVGSAPGRAPHCPGTCFPQFLQEFSWRRRGPVVKSEACRTEKSVCVKSCEMIFEALKIKTSLQRIGPGSGCSAHPHRVIPSHAVGTFWHSKEFREVRCLDAFLPR